MASVTSQPVAGERKDMRSESRAGMGLLSSLVMYSVLFVMAIVSAYPFWWMLVAATRRSADILTIPPPILPGHDLTTNYRDLIAQMPFWRAMFNSMYVGVLSTVMTLFFCSLAGYGFAKFRFPGRDKAFALMLATMMIPGVLGIIPSFMLMKWLHWLDTYWPLIIPGAANAFGIFWMRQYIESAIPDDLMDAARIDGAHEFRIYWAIVLPVITPALAALSIMTFMGSWNSFFWPLLILKDEAKYTLPVALAGLQGIYGYEMGVWMLGATMAIAPVMVVFLMSARRFMAGLTTGAVEGV